MGIDVENEIQSVGVYICMYMWLRQDYYSLEGQIVWVNDGNTER